MGIRPIRNNIKPTNSVTAVTNKSDGSESKTAKIKLGMMLSSPISALYLERNQIPGTEIAISQRAKPMTMKQALLGTEEEDISFVFPLRVLSKRVSLPEQGCPVDYVDSFKERPMFPEDSGCERG